MIRSLLIGRLWAPLVALLLLAAPASAQTDFFWNAPTGGDGAWDTSSTLWSLNAGGPVDQTWLNDGTAHGELWRHRRDCDSFKHY